MSIGNSIANAWHKHPYIIMGVGGVIVVYLLWPSSTSTSSDAATSTDPYGEQLAAETALSETQLAEQAQSDQTQATENAALQAAADSSIATGNEAIAQSNAAAIVSYNQTAQTGIEAAGSLAIAQQQNSNADFTALLNGLTSFGTSSYAAGTADSANASANGLDAYLTAIGATFADTTNADGSTNINVTNWGETNQSSGVNLAGSTYFGGGTGTVNGNLASSATFDAGASGPAVSTFTNSEDLLGGLWSQAISTYNAQWLNPSSPSVQPLPVAPLLTSPVLTGNVQPIPAAITT